MKFKERRRHKSGKSAFRTPREYFNKSHYHLFYFTLKFLLFPNSDFVLIYFLQSIISSVSQGDGFTEVTRGSKKRKASTSSTLPNQPKPGSPLGTPVRPKPYKKNTIPVIISGVDEKFKSCRKLN